MVERSKILSVRPDLMASEPSTVTPEEEKVLQQLPGYHGYLPREDAILILKKDGDYLLRLSEVDNVPDPLNIHREIILSVMVQLDTAGKIDPLDKSTAERGGIKMSSFIIRHMSTKYYIEKEYIFQSVKEVLDHYATKGGCINHKIFKLVNPIPLQRWELVHSSIVLGTKLGEGAFGEVRQAVLTKKNRTLDVAVKVTKVGVGVELGKMKIKEMMKEARLMRDMKHPNVVRTMGVAVDVQPLYIVLELIRGGALVSYLVKSSGLILTREKMLMCYGAALGVRYLHENQYIHRDLAARNCLYTENKKVKISDFGLSRKSLHYVMKSTGVKLPIKWLAPETITSSVFSNKTDVYSFGVMLYEIFSDGTEPWPGVTNSQVKKNLAEGTMLQITHEECPEKWRIYINERILCHSAEKRSTMHEIVSEIEAILTNMYGPCKTEDKAPTSDFLDKSRADPSKSDKSTKKKRRGFHMKERSTRETATSVTQSVIQSAMHK